MGHNDEYVARLRPTEPGLWGALYRYRERGRPGWIYADLDGHDGAPRPGRVSRIIVPKDAPGRPLTVATINLQCLDDRWPERMEMLVEALAPPAQLNAGRECASVPSNITHDRSGRAQAGARGPGPRSPWHGLMRETRR